MLTNGIMTKTIVLKVDVDTYRGTQEGVPRLLNLFKSRGVNATFLFSLGPDHTGRALKQVFRPGFLTKVARTSVLEHYGLKTLLYGTLLPGPDIGRSLAPVLRATASEGFETGIHCWNHICWQERVSRADAEWTQQQMRLAVDRYQEIFGYPATTHGAAGWQMNGSSYREELALGLKYASDGRGTSPFRPLVDGQEIACIQLPTTLPTVDELLCTGKVGPDNVDRYVIASSMEERMFGHVYTLHAELEGMRMLPAMERMLDAWQTSGYRMFSLGDLYRSLDIERLPRHHVSTGRVPGRPGLLSTQGELAATPQYKKPFLRKSKSD